MAARRRADPRRRDRLVPPDWLRRSGSRTVIDNATGEEMVIGGNDSLFFVPVRFWASILALIGVGTLVYPLVQG